MITLNGRGNWKKIVDKFGGECCVEYVWRKIFDRNVLVENLDNYLWIKNVENFGRNAIY